MSRRETWLSAGAIFVLALAVRAVAAAAVTFPVPEDTAYYDSVARNLLEGRGLISDALWSYQTQPLVVPRAAFEVWLPLPSLLAAIPMAAVGVGNWFRAAQVMSVLASSCVAVLAWRLGADLAAEMQLPVGRARTMGLGTGLVAAVFGPLVLYGTLPDSTALFTVLSLAACLLMTRIAARAAARDPDATGNGASTVGLAAAVSAQIDSRLVVLGALLGLAALTRSEAIWLALAWAVLAWFWTPGSRRRRLGLIAVPAVVAGLVFAPWAIRDWLVFGSPLPGQTLANALSVHSYDIFAYQDVPSLARYLAQGPVALVGARLVGLAHDLFTVLLIPAFPVGPLGLLVLPWVGRRRTLRPLVLVSICTFVVTSLLFPVSTLSGTYIHAAGSAVVLLTVCCMAALDSFIDRVGRLRGWTQPVAWLGPAFAVVAVGPLCVVTITAIAGFAGGVDARYEALPAAMARAGVPLDGKAPVIADYPIWLAESARIPTLALPQESPAAVLDLARRFGAKLVVVYVDPDVGGVWPDILNGGGTAARCFQDVPLTDASGAMPGPGSDLAGITVFRIVCP